MFFRRFAVLCGILIVSVSQVHSQSLPSDSAALRRIQSLVTNGAVVLADEQGSIRLAHNLDRLLVPASIIKILTAQIAMDVLGDDFRFKTDFYVDAEDNLYIKGWGDPFLVSDEIDTIATRLTSSGLQRVRGVYLDASSFEPDIRIPGVSSTSNPYDAVNGALAVNFNTVNVRKGADGAVLSGEPETPLTPMARAKAGVLSPGTRQRINLTGNHLECRQYAGELVCAMLSKNGVVIPQETVAQGIPQGRLIYSHLNSRDLSTVVKGLMQYSNNFIANQIYLTVGATRLGYPASLARSNAFFNNHAQTVLGIPREEMQISEGSGISRDSKLTARAMMKVLEYFRPRADLLPRKGNALVKSGTLSGVYNYAGYVETADGLRPFVIILNQPGNHRDTILSILAKLP